MSVLQLSIALGGLVVDSAGLIALFVVSGAIVLVAATIAGPVPSPASVAR